jgi:hypothetical protein
LEGGGCSIYSRCIWEKEKTTLLEFKEMLRGDHSISDIGDCAMRVMEYAQLGKIEKGSVSSEGKFKSLHGRWFNAKKSTTLKGADEKIPCTGQFIQRNSLITLNAKRGKTVSVEYYRVLGIFSKHYNKWYLHWDEEKVPFVFGSKKFNVMALGWLQSIIVDLRKLIWLLMGTGVQRMFLL